MKKILLFPCAFIFALSSKSQHANFENFSLPAESSLHGQDQVTDGDTLYSSGGYVFENNYNAGWGSFSGWAISNVTDVVTTGWSNQFSAIPGEGSNGSENYSVCYVSSWNNNRVFNTGSSAQLIHGFYVTNTTYAYHAMLNGDDFTKPFGADTNAQGIVDGTNGEDWFLLTIYGLDEDSLYTGDSVNFYLADFRFTNDANDYIIDEWTWVNLTSLGEVKGLDFVLSSTDTSGGFGMNNPSYFAMDELNSVFVSINEEDKKEISVYPNPTSNIVNVILPQNASLQIFDVSGKLIFETITSETTFTFDFSDFQSGVYFMNVISEGKIYTEKIIKH